MTVTTAGAGDGSGKVVIVTIAGAEVPGAVVGVTGAESMGVVDGNRGTVMVGVTDGQGAVMVVTRTDCEDVAVGPNGIVTVDGPCTDDNDDVDNEGPTTEWLVWEVA